MEGAGALGLEREFLYKELTSEIIGAAIEVHRELGPGLLESVYEECLAAELESRRISFRRQAPLLVCYKGRELGTRLLMDLVVEEKVVLELKAVEQLLPIHEAQLLTYLRLGHYRLGYLINFNCTKLTAGLRRLIL